MALDINGTIKITGGTPGNGKILTSDANGLASWEENPGATSLNDLSDAIAVSTNVFIGTHSGATSINLGNTALGYSSLHSNTTGSNNVAIGKSAGYVNTSGTGNTAVGEESLFYNSIGINNTAIGKSAGQGSLGNSYSGCVFLGNEAGFHNTEDDKLYIENSNSPTPLIGGDFDDRQVDINGTIKITGGTPGSGKVLTSDADGLSSWETPTTYASDINELTDAAYNGSDLFLGNGAGINNSGSNSNLAVGRNALTGNTTSDFNTAIGNLSLVTNTGASNTAIGYFSLHDNTTGIKNTSLGYRTGYDNHAGSYNTFIGYNARMNNTDIKDNSTAIGNEVVITASDQVRIGNGDISSIGGVVPWSTVSDGRFKENIKEDVAGLDFVLNLRPVSYTVNKQAFSHFVGSEYQSNNRTASTRECGFVAQEVEELIQKTGVEFNGVDAPENSNDYYGIRYSQFVMPLVKSVQELNEKLEKENAELKAQNTEMLQRLEKLEEIMLKK